MRIACAAFTKAALVLARSVRDALAAQGDAVSVSCPARLVDSLDVHTMEDLALWAREAWEQADALLFVSACGIATRAIAPQVQNKYSDPAVVCLDESAAFAIPLLSGHVGGANKLARRVADVCGAQAVVTTATDVRHVFAVDEWAREQGLAILDREEAKRVSATLLEGGEVGFASDVPVLGELPQGVVNAKRDLGMCISCDADKRPFPHTLRLVPRTVVVGVGCKRGTSAEAILDHVDSCLASVRVAVQAVRAMATIDVKADEEGLVEAARQRGWPLKLYGAEELAAVPGEFSSSEFVRASVGVDNVCERAACAEGATLLLRKQAAQGVTVALASTDPQLSFASRACADMLQGRHSCDTPTVTCVGLGPGAGCDLTLRADAALRKAHVIVGYTTYVGLIRDAYPHAEFVTTGMRGEIARCRKALELAGAGRRVAVVCSGDPGVYGMAGLLYELAEEYPGVEVEVVAGVSAANGGAAVLGAPLMHDWCSISLSDLMTPWRTIEERLRAAARADFCVALYNPSSRNRADYLRHACDILLEHKDATTVCGMVRNVGRKGQTSTILSLGELRDAQADMLTCVFVGNAQTRVVGGHMVTPRGYELGDKRTPSDAARPEVLVFGGTVEGRSIAEWLSSRNTCNVTYCAATAYGASLVAQGARITAVQGPLSAEQKRELMESHDFACIVDATHPFAQHISSSIQELGKAYGKYVVRIAREESAEEDGAWTTVPSVQQAAQVVARIHGNVLLTTGTKDLANFVEAMPDYAERLYVRMLPVQASLAVAEQLRIPPAHILAMQGPFSARLNVALIQEHGIQTLVTKQSGTAGGFDQKVEAARECGIGLVVVERPQSDGGVSVREAQRLLEERYGL